MSWYTKVIKNYAGFKGRARRKEFWMFYLFYVIFSILAMILDNFFGTKVILPYGYGFELSFGYIHSIYILAILIPTLAVLVRRLHDVGKSAGWMFISFIPLIGGIWLLILTCTDSQVGDNKYGENPKDVEADNTTI